MTLQHLFLPALLALGLGMAAAPAEAGGHEKTHKKTPAASTKADVAKSTAAKAGPSSHHHRHHKQGGKGGKHGKTGSNGKSHGHKHKPGKRK
jgi:hypothetical protein